MSYVVFVLKPHPIQFSYPNIIYMTFENAHITIKSSKYSLRCDTKPFPDANWCNSGTSMYYYAFMCLIIGWLKSHSRYTEEQSKQLQRCTAWSSRTFTRPTDHSSRWHEHEACNKWQRTLRGCYTCTWKLRARPKQRKNYFLSNESDVAIVTPEMFLWGLIGMTCLSAGNNPET